MRYNVYIYSRKSVLIANHSCKTLGEAQRTADKYNSMKHIYAEVGEIVYHS